MPVDAKLLEILRCPVTKQAVSLLSPDKLSTLNAKIEKGEIRHLDGTPVQTPLGAALITENGTVIYKVEDDIPIMLIDEAIPMEQVG